MNLKRWVQRSFEIFSFSCFFVLTLPTTKTGIIGNLIIQASLVVYYYWLTERSTTAHREDSRLDLLSLSVSIGLLAMQVQVFHEVWFYSSKVRNLALRLSLSGEAFLWVSPSLCALFSLPGVYQFVTTMVHKRRIPFFCTVVLFLSFVQIQISTNYLLADAFLRSNWMYIILNLAVLWVVCSPFFLLIKNQGIACIVTSAILTLFALINYFVMLYHGTPLFPNEFLNITAAWDVLSGYKIHFDRIMISIILVFPVQLLLVRFGFKEDRLRTAKAVLLKAAALLGALYVILLSPVSIDTSIGFQWQSSVRNKGFLCCSVRDFQNLIHPLKRPNGYDPNIITVNESSYEEEELALLPDLFIILNETFCDLGEYCQLDTDVPYMQNFYSIPGAKYGHTTSSIIGGGTNNSEFELLTSNSMFLLEASAPFRYLDCRNLDTSVIHLLKSLGYETTAMHCRAATNYARDKAYPALEFDRVILGARNFTFNAYGNRIYLDRDNYQDMLTAYEKSDKDVPQFYYLLTYQNHGGYKQNDASLDLVHVKNDYGRLTDEINEYLSSLSLSAEAFCDLTEYFSGIDRPVLVCMLGDHAPSFITEIPQNKVTSLQPTEIAQRTVPFVMWSNYDVKFPENLDYASMVDLVPIMLETAGIPLTPYFECILSLHEDVPLRLYNGDYMDKEGNIGNYSSACPFFEKLSQYYYMEYNGLNRDKDYKEELFMVREPTE